MSDIYRSYANYLRDRYGQKVYRVSLDAGFSCPHRGPDRSHPGCTFCEGTGGRAPYLGLAAEAESAASLGPRLERLGEQVAAARRFLERRYRAKRFILYFQAYSSTYATVGELEQIYDYALSLGPFCEMVVATRPDCVQEDVAALLASYQRDGLRVWVELGLQSAHERTLTLINRGHTVAEFLTAFRLLRRHGLALAVHLILGLPGEGRSQILETVRVVASIRPEGLKIHNLHIQRGATLMAEYLAGEVTAPGPERHLGYVIDAIERVPSETVIMRVTCDTPQSRLASPRGFWSKGDFYERLRKEMQRRATWQGRFLVDGIDPTGVPTL